MIVFTAKINGEEKELLVKKPGYNQQREGWKAYNRAFSDAVNSGAMLRARLESFMEEQGMWDDTKQAEFARLNKSILDIEKLLAKGGIKLSEAKVKALELSDLRRELNLLVQQRTEQDINTAEGQADNARFNYWVSSCVVYNDNKKPVFLDVDDYLEKQAEDYASKAAAKLAQLIYGIDEDFDNKLPEAKFLKRFKFVDDKGRLINKNGDLVDRRGRLIDKDGNFVNEAGDKVDSEGNLLDEDGNYLFKEEPFLDEDGNPIKLEE